MHNSKTVYEDFIRQISLSESQDEIRSMAQLVLGKFFGISRKDILIGSPFVMRPDQLDLLQQTAARINTGEPVQYILGEAEFYGRTFLVNPAVLIPRPETEELVHEIWKVRAAQLKILDIGTGSGCIPITLALEIPRAEIFATDVSPEALRVASQNARKLQANVFFIHHDILKDELPVNDLDVVVSNPPYISIREMDQMKKNVVAYEPHLALFVPDDNPLLFYEAIAARARTSLKWNGTLIVEINERFGSAVSALFASYDFKNVEIIKDMSGKDRIVRGTKTS
jgi:release factor glutamine methyltransferase